MKQWTLSQDSFDRFLHALDEDRERAGREYSSLRTRIVRFFEWRSCFDAESLTDEVFDRVIRKNSEGVEMASPANYAFGVAKLVLLENSKTQHRVEPIVIDFPSAEREVPVDDALACLERCLAKISRSSRELILRYYSFDKKVKIDDRRTLAESLGLTPNALRIKALRVRSKIEKCVTECLAERK